MNKWYITWNRPNMKAAGGAFWPVMAIRHIDIIEDEDTVRHEESHMKTQLSMLLLPWIVVYGIFLLTHGYHENPFERHARAVAYGKKWEFLGWTKYVRKTKPKWRN